MSSNFSPGERALYTVMLVLLLSGAICFVGALWSGRWMAYAVGAACWAMFAFLYPTTTEFS